MASALGGIDDGLERRGANAETEAAAKTPAGGDRDRARAARPHARPTRAGLEAGPTTPIALAGTVSGRSAHTRTRARRTRPWPCAPRASLVPRHAARQSEAPLGALCRLHESAMQNASPPRSWTPPDRRALLASHSGLTSWPAPASDGQPDGGVRRRRPPRGLASARARDVGHRDPLAQLPEHRGGGGHGARPRRSAPRGARRPLTELAGRLRSIGPRGPYPALGPQPLAELEQVADEYRKMAERLEAFEQLNVDAVLDEKAKTEAVIESIDDGLIVLDPAGHVLHMNEVARAILGLDRMEVPGAPFDRLGSDHPHYLRLREVVRELLAHPDREPERVELALFLRGRDHHYVLRPTALRARDQARAGLIVALQDVTYLRDQEARFEQLVATLSHELGSPLTSLRMAVELLGRDDAPAPRALVDAAQEDVARLQDLAQRLLDLSRARATSIPLERRNVDLREVIPRTVKLFALQAREKGIALESAVADAGLTIAGDPTKLTWALSNLLANALRYTPAGGSVRVEAASADGTVVVSVTDTGDGIPPDQQERIFERFVQSGEGGNIGAAGLGLSIVRDIVQAHGGRIHVECTVGAGSCFTLELPRG